MAYELLTGHPPFVGNGYQQMWHQHVHAPPSPLNMINPSFISTGSGQANLIAVVAKGSNIDLYVNQHHIDGTQDTYYSDGRIGALAKIFVKGKSEVAFSDATVWTL